MTMDYTKKQVDYAYLKPLLEKALDNHETINGTANFNKQKQDAEKGDASAQVILGILFALGVRGVTQHFIFAHMWFNLSSSNGNKDGGNFRDEVAKQLSVTYMNEAQDRADKCTKNNYKDWDKN